MKDRIVEFPNRYRIVPVEGTSDLVDLLPVPGVITDIGTPINKNTLLRDETAAQYGMDSTATVNDIFMALKMPAGYYGFAVTAKFSDGTPAPSLKLNGLLAFDQSIAVTDENGFCYAMSSESTPVVEFSDYIGIASQTVTIQATDGTTYTPVEVVVEKETEIHLFETSCEVQVYPGALLDLCAVGGGGCGFNGYGGGGGGGYAKNELGIAVESDTLSVVIGAGGTNSSKNGGTTSVSADGVILVSATGGYGATSLSGASGNGNGGTGNNEALRATNGTAGSVRVFNDASLPLPGGGGGGCSNAQNSTSGGADYGGSVSGTNAVAPTGPGGGGAAGMSGYRAGHAGAVYVRARYE